MLKLAALILVISLTTSARAIDPVFLVKDIRKEIKDEKVIASSIGVTRDGVAIDCLLHAEDLDFSTKKTRVLLVGNSSWASRSIGAAILWFYNDPAAAALRKKFVLSAVPKVYPGRPRSPNSVSFPPTGKGYHSLKNPEGHYLWQWIGMHAPDLVVEVRQGRKRTWFVPKSEDEALQRSLQKLNPTANGQTKELAAGLVKSAPCETGTIPAIRATTASDGSKTFLPELLHALQAADFRGPSPARREIQRRLDRSPLEVAKQLSGHYGGHLNQVVYIPAMALIGRVRLGKLAGDQTHREQVEKIVAPYFQGDKPTTPRSGSGLSGHLIFCELAAASEGEKRRRYLQLARNAADLAFDKNGGLKPSMPFHSEMSDALFMGGPILARVGKLTGDGKYYAACIRHLRFMRKIVLRSDGLYRHSPLDEAAWGRGNGFPALGLAMCLSAFPRNHPERDELLEIFRDHLSTLAKHQDPTGCWHQVVDRPESYRELSSTCMIAYAMARGVRSGWLDRGKYDAAIRKAWYAIRTRVTPNGRLVDVCTGTGKQKNLRAYYDRPAILGPDARGGAMALMASTEMAAYLQSAKE